MKKQTNTHHARAHRKSRRHAHPAQLPPNINPPPNPDIPCWLPTEVSNLGLPQSVQESLTRIILPAYRAFVLEAPGELERTIGNSVVYLAWLELVNQIRLANTVADSNSPDAIVHDPDKLTDRCLQLMAAKCQAAGLMLKVRLATEALNRSVAHPMAPEGPAKLEIPRNVDQLHQRVSPATSPHQKASELERCRSVDQLRRPVPSGHASPEDLENGRHKVS